MSSSQQSVRIVVVNSAVDHTQKESPRVVVNLSQGDQLQRRELYRLAHMLKFEAQHIMSKTGWRKYTTIDLTSICELTERLKSLASDGKK